MPTVVNDGNGVYLATIVSSRETYGERDGTQAVERFNREYRRSWLIELLPSDSQCGPETIYKLPGYPKFCDMYQAANGSLDVGSYCKTRSAKQVEAPWIWRLDVHYSGDVDLRNPTGDPLQQPAVYRWSSKTATMPVEYAYGGPDTAFAAMAAPAQAAVAAAQANYNAALAALQAETQFPSQSTVVIAKATAAVAAAQVTLDAANAALVPNQTAMFAAQAAVAAAQALVNTTGPAATAAENLANDNPTNANIIASLSANVAAANAVAALDIAQGDLAAATVATTAAQAAIDSAQIALNDATAALADLQAAQGSAPSTAALQATVRAAAAQLAFAQVNLSRVKAKQVLVAVRNSAGDPYDPPLTIEYSWPTLTLTKNFDSYNPLTSSLYTGSVNSDVFMGFQPGQVLCTQLGAENIYQQGQIYWRVSASFEFKQGVDAALNGADAWAYRVLDKGWNAIDPVSGLALTILDPHNGRQKQVVTLLDGKGHVKAPGSPPVFNVFYARISQAFGLLGLL